MPGGNLSGTVRRHGFVPGTLFPERNLRLFCLPGRPGPEGAKLYSKVFGGLEMGDLKRTQLYEEHLKAGATMVDFGGWEMPVQYPAGIVAEHLYTRRVCSLFDVSHMGRLIVEGPQWLAGVPAARGLEQRRIP